MAERGVTTERALVRQRDDGRAIWMLGGLYEIRLSSDDTGGELTIMEFTIPVGAAPPLHVHAVDEHVYVLEGRARYHLGDETREVGPGDVVFIPRGVKETFEPTTTVRMLNMYTPGGIDRFFVEAGEPAARREVPPAPSGAPDFARLASIASRHGLELLGPPA